MRNVWLQQQSVLQQIVHTFMRKQLLICIRMEYRKQVRIMWQITQERWKYPQLRLEAIFIMEEVFIQ